MRPINKNRTYSTCGQPAVAVKTIRRYRAQGRLDRAMGCTLPSPRRHEACVQSTLPIEISETDIEGLTRLGLLPAEMRNDLSAVVSALYKSH
jgi:hypothetical protein